MDFPSRNCSCGILQFFRHESESNELERIQMQALKAIYGWRLSYRCLLELSGLERLDVRRARAFREMAIKLFRSDRYVKWFPRRLERGYSPRASAPREFYKIPAARTERYRKSPFNRMRRLLNEIKLEPTE